MQEEELLEKIRGSHEEVFVTLDTTAESVLDQDTLYREIDRRIVNLGTFGSLSDRFYSTVFVPKNAAKEIIAKLEKSPYLIYVNGEYTRQSPELSSLTNLLFSYRPYAKIAGTVLGIVGVGLYLANRIKP